MAWINASSVAAPTAGAAAHTSLATVRGYVGADVVEAACQRMPMTRQAVGPDGVVNDPELRERIATILHTLLHHTLSGTTRT